MTSAAVISAIGAGVIACRITVARASEQNGKIAGFQSERRRVIGHCAGVIAHRVACARARCEAGIYDKARIPRVRGDGGVVIGDGFSKPPEVAIDDGATDLGEELLIAAHLRVIRAIDQLRAWARRCSGVAALTGLPSVGTPSMPMRHFEKGSSLSSIAWLVAALAVAAGGRGRSAFGAAEEIVLGTIPSNGSAAAGVLIALANTPKHTICARILPSARYGSGEISIGVGLSHSIPVEICRGG